MPLDSFPPEIISIIGNHIASINDLFNFLRSNRRLYNVLINSLYRRNTKSDGGSALVWYASQGNETGIRSMLAAGGNINIREPKQAQSTALMEAVRHNHTAIVKVLLENGALPDAADLHSRRPLTLSTSARSDVAITKLLLEYGANINLVAFDKRAPLVEAIRSNQDVKVGLLLDHGADIHITSSRDAMSPLHIAAARNAKPAIIKVLVDAGIYVDAPDGRGRTPLQVAAMHSSTRAVRWLLDCGATANFENTSPDSQGWTALFYAVKSKNSRIDNKTIIKTLLLHGAKIDTTNFAKETPLLHAVSQGATKQAQILLEYGANGLSKEELK
ncbi:hypothetical protein PMG11_11390 [Penicillium brasilianum]|uniref:Uncharacterized protein n=1 Tax=Penicillium brasilianum TaxID=104259 RepID=A0A0F7U539_PENBI|nr:hypothetical protein PMG11_11390 [Penicillium brasilianum]